MNTGGRLARIGFFLTGALATLLVNQFASAGPQGPVLEAAKRCEPRARALLEQLVNIDSGTADLEGLGKMVALLQVELDAVGAQVEKIASSAPGTGENVVATLTGRGRGRILLIAHMDTVFPHGTVAARPFRVAAEQGIGPGAGDDKNGIVTAICALRVLHEIKFEDYATIVLLLNSNEETGSLGTRDLIRAKAKASDVAINLERGVPPDALEVTRKGSAVITLEIFGKAAHAGLEPEKGRNAIMEASHQALKLASLSDSQKETTVNVTMIEGGNAINVIPDHALIRADVRAFSAQEMDRVEESLKNFPADTMVPGIEVHASMTRNFPPWPRTPSTDDLLARAQRLYAEVGGKLSGVPVGSSADVAFAAETGTPSIDGIAILGAGAHGVDDRADLSTIVARVYLLSRMLMDLGRSPPVTRSPPH